MELLQISDLLGKITEKEITINDNSQVIVVKPEDWDAIAEKLKSELQLSFDYLMCITSYDQGDSQNFGLAYNFHSTEHKHSIEIRIEFNIEVEIPSVAGIWRTADWHEREAYDMMGIIFSGHPNFKRILLPEDWVGYPLRKDYKVDDYYHGMPIPKDKSYWE